MENAILPITAWNRSAREFMKYIGMKDDKFGCPKISSFRIDSSEQDLVYSFVITPKWRIQQPSRSFSEPILPANLSSIASNEIYIKEPNNIPGWCAVTSHRAVMRRLSQNQN